VYSRCRVEQMRKGDLPKLREYKAKEIEISLIRIEKSPIS
jgi:hypothetical protein